MSLKRRIEQLLEPLGYKRTEEGFGSIQIENTPGTTWALKYKEQDGHTKKWTQAIAYSFNGPRSAAYVKYVDAQIYDKLVPIIMTLVEVIESQELSADEVMEKLCKATNTPTPIQNSTFATPDPCSLQESSPGTSQIDS